jgi:hypothetical protein
VCSLDHCLPQASGAPAVRRLAVDVSAVGRLAGGLPPAARGRRQHGQLVDVVPAQRAAAAGSVPGAAMVCRLDRCLPEATGAPALRVAVDVDAAGDLAGGRRRMGTSCSS